MRDRSSKRVVSLMLVMALIGSAIPGLHATSTGGAQQSRSALTEAAPTDAKAQIAQLKKRSRAAQIVARAERMQLFHDYLTAPTPALAKARLLAIRADRLQRASVSGDSSWQRPRPTRLTMPPALLAPAVDVSEAGSHGPSSRSECYLGEEEPCQTQEEQDEFEMFLGESLYEVATLETEYYESEGDYAAHCSEYPWTCYTTPDGETRPLSGPSVLECADASCFDQANQALTEIVTTGIAALLAAGKLDEAKVAAKHMSKYTVYALRATVGVGLVTAAFWTGYYSACVIDTLFFQELNHNHVDPYEPSVGFRLHAPRLG